jgi:hypothetical protein
MSIEIKGKSPIILPKKKPETVKQHMQKKLKTDVKWVLDKIMKPGAPKKGFRKRKSFKNEGKK